MADVELERRKRAEKEAALKREQEDAAQAQMDPKLARTFELMSYN